MIKAGCLLKIVCSYILSLLDLNVLKKKSSIFCRYGAVVEILKFPFFITFD